MRTRPTFAKPPLIEVVCQVQFATLAALQAPYVAYFWDMIKARFPRAQSLPPLAAGFSMPHNQPAQMTMQLTNIPEMPRIWFINETDTELVQLQQDRFIFNWKRTAQHDVPYPRFPNVLEQFKQLFGLFEKFLADYALGAIQPVQLELVYVNHIKPGVEIGRLREVQKVFPDLTWRGEPPRRFLPEPKSLNFRTQFDMPEGRLAVGLATVTRDAEQPKMILRFDLAARGLPSDGDLWRWFDVANTWVVDAFVDLTSAEAQKMWERTQ